MVEGRGKYGENLSGGLLANFSHMIKSKRNEEENFGAKRFFTRC